MTTFKSGNLSNFSEHFFKQTFFGFALKWRESFHSSLSYVIKYILLKGQEVWNHLVWKDLEHNLPNKMKQRTYSNLHDAFKHTTKMLKVLAVPLIIICGDVTLWIGFFCMLKTYRLKLHVKIIHLDFCVAGYDLLILQLNYSSHSLAVELCSLKEAETNTKF